MSTSAIKSAISQSIIEINCRSTFRYVGGSWSINGFDYLGLVMYVPEVTEFRKCTSGQYNDTKMSTNAIKSAISLRIVEGSCRSIFRYVGGSWSILGFEYHGRAMYVPEIAEL